VQPRTDFQSYHVLAQTCLYQTMCYYNIWLGLSKESALQLDITVGGSFNHKTIVEGENHLDRILENTPPLEPLHVEPELSHEEVPLAKAEPIPPI
jgi:hypothetical protein